MGKPALRYTAAGAFFVPDVPARDLDADELPEIAARLGMTVEALKTRLVEGGCYAATTPPPAPTVSAAPQKG